MVDEHDAKRITELYKMKSSALMGYAMLCMGGDRLSSEDLVNDAFHDLYRQWVTVSDRDDEALYAWLRCVVRHKSVSVYRKLRRIVVYDPQDPLAPLDGRADSDLAHTVLAADLLDKCAAIIQELPMRLRMAILLRAEGYSSSVVAAQMGVVPATVRGYWADAIEELRCKVGDVMKILYATEEPDKEHSDATEGPDKEDGA